jgi:hypothetical protein
VELVELSETKRENILKKNLKSLKHTVKTKILGTYGEA